MRTQLMDLPKEIVFDILSRLPVTSLCCIRCVSKALLHTVDDRLFVSLHTARLITATNPVADDHQAPRLMFLFRCGEYVLPSVLTGVFMALGSMKYDGSRGVLTASKYAVKISGSDLSYKADYRVSFVYCNLFFLKCRYVQEAFLLNPLREGEVLRLARVKRYGNVTSGDCNWYSLVNKRVDPTTLTYGDWYGMGFDSISSTHKILRVSWSSEAPCRVAEILVLGTSSWREISSLPPTELDGVRLDGAYDMKTLCAYGDMHWLIRGRNIGTRSTSYVLISFDFKKEEFYSIPHPPLKSSDSQPHHFHLLTLRGSMAILEASLSRRGRLQISIWVLKDYDNKQWTRDYYRQIKTTESECEAGILLDAHCGEWEHGIYYKIGINRNHILFLDLRCGDEKWLIFRRHTDQYVKIFNYTGSLISLKDYDSVNSEELITEGLRSYGNLIEGEEQGFSISEKQILRGTSFIKN